MFGGERRFAVITSALLAGLVSQAILVSNSRGASADLSRTSKGSPLALALNVFEITRELPDPLTGNSGWSLENTAGLVDRLVSRYDPSAMRGFSMGEAGQMFRQLYRRGLIDTNPEKGSPDPVESVATKIKRRLESMAGPLSAVSDMLEDQRNP